MAILPTLKTTSTYITHRVAEYLGYATVAEFINDWGKLSPNEQEELRYLLYLEIIYR